MKRDTWHPWLVISAWLIAGVILWAPAVFADDDDPPMQVECLSAANPSQLGGTGWQTFTVPDGEHVHLFTREGEWSWCRWKSGPQGCLYTADPLHPEQGIGGGRDCREGQTSQCAFIVPGQWSVWGAAGKGCAGFDIDLCGGIC